jgi:uncharacterized membrane protein
MGENNFAPIPVAVYGTDLLMSALAFWLLQRSLIRSQGRDSVLARALGSDAKGNASLAIYIVSVAVATWYPLVACSGYVLVAILWLIPDTRIERTIATSK